MNSFAESTEVTHILTSDVKKKFRCDTCNQCYTSKAILFRHKLIHSDEKPFVCEFCEKRFSRIDGLRDHKMTHFDKKPFPCDECSKSFRRRYNLKLHKMSKHNSKLKIKTFEEKVKLKDQEKKHSSERKKMVKERKTMETQSCRRKVASDDRKTGNREQETEIKEKKSELCLYEEFKAKTHHLKRRDIFNVLTTVTFELCEQDLTLFFEKIKLDFYNELFFQLLDKKRYQWYIFVSSTLVRSCYDNNSNYLIPHLRSEVITQLDDDTLLENIEEVFQKIKISFEEFNTWTFVSINFLELNIAKF